MSFDAQFGQDFQSERRVQRPMGGSKRKKVKDERDKAMERIVRRRNRSL